MILPDVHFEGITKVTAGEFKLPVDTAGAGLSAAYRPTGASAAENGTLGPKRADAFGMATDVDKEISAAKGANDARASRDPYMYYPGAVYNDAGGRDQRCANTGHFGRLDSLEGAAKMASMNVFTAADGGK